MTTDTSTSTQPEVNEYTVSVARRRLTEATQAYERNKAALFHPATGQPIYADHGERLQAVEADLETAMRSIHETVNQVRAAAAAIEAAEEHADPTGRLTPAELERANQRAMFVREDAERLPLDQLAARMRQAIATGDKALTFLWLRYGQARMDAEQRTERRRTPGEGAAAGEILTLLRQARATFQDTKALARAERLREESGALFAEMIRHPVSMQREQAQLRASGRYGF